MAAKKNLRMEFADYRGHFVGCNPVEVGAAAEAHIAELHVAIRPALDFLQERFGPDGKWTDGHAQMVAMALAGAIRKRIN